MKEPSAPKANTNYLYDPKHRLSTPDCDLKKDLCKIWWQDGPRQRNMAFSEPKAIRLAFHDCMPYEDSEGGCDGCLNFEVNEDEHNVLQPTVAILVIEIHYNILNWAINTK